MTKMKMKIALIGCLSLISFGTLTTSCGKDDNNPEELPNGNIEAAVGTYKGKLYARVLPNEQRKTWYDAIVIVSKEGSNKLKISAKTGQEYSAVTSKTFTVETGAFFGTNTQDIVSLTGSMEGMFSFYGSNKTIVVTTDQQASSDIDFEFEGTKQ